MSEYQGLRKIYHKSEAEAQEVYEKRFNSKDAIQLGFTLEGSPAFFIMDSEVYQLIVQAERLDKQIRMLIGQLPEAAINQYLNRTLIDEIVLTNEIEGVHSSRQEIGEVLERLEKYDKRGRFQGIVQKYVALSSGDIMDLSSCESIRELYDELVLDEVVREDPKNAPDGEIFRRGPTHVIDQTGRAIHDGVEPEARIIELTNRALAILMDEEIELIARTSIFHFLFSYIHPFYDGNGRTNRFISSYVLAHEFSPLPGLRLSFAIKEHIGDYYRAFSTVEHALNRGDLTPFVISFANIIVAAMESMRDSLAEKEFDYRMLCSRLKVVLPEGCAQEQLMALCDILAQAALFSERGLTVKQIAVMQGVTAATIYNRLKPLEAYGLVKRERLGRETFLMLDIVRLGEIAD